MLKFENKAAFKLIIQFQKSVPYIIFKKLEATVVFYFCVRSLQFRLHDKICLRELLKEENKVAISMSIKFSCHRQIYLAEWNSANCKVISEIDDLFLFPKLLNFTAHQKILRSPNIYRIVNIQLLFAVHLKWMYINLPSKVC